MTALWARIETLLVDANRPGAGIGQPIEPRPIPARRVVAAGRRVGAHRGRMKGN